MAGQNAIVHLIPFPSPPSPVTVHLERSECSLVRVEQQTLLLATLQSS